MSRPLLMMFFGIASEMGSGGSVLGITGSIGNPDTGGVTGRIGAWTGCRRGGDASVLTGLRKCQFMTIFLACLDHILFCVLAELYNGSSRVPLAGNRILDPDRV